MSVTPCAIWNSGQNIVFDSLSILDNQEKKCFYESISASIYRVLLIVPFQSYFKA